MIPHLFPFRFTTSCKYRANGGYSGYQVGNRFGGLFSEIYLCYLFLHNQDAWKPLSLGHVLVVISCFLFLGIGLSGHGEEGGERGDAYWTIIGTFWKRIFFITLV